MSRISKLFIQGDELFDRSDFDGAIKIFEEALSLDEESNEDTHTKEAILDNLNQARRLAHLVLLRRLLEKFPDSILLQKDHIRWYLGHYHPQRATELCDALFAQLERGNSTWRPYSLRISVARKNGVVTHLVEDIVALWKSLNPTNSKGKRRFLQSTLAISDVRLLPAFIELSQHPEFSPNIQTLFRQKAESLQLLQQIYETELA
ncbi:MAG: hypothetical protein HY862_06985 [Chloroflexi bacterium]|nr:hypothetical protein [Chloroflexota bacterium]